MTNKEIFNIFRNTCFSEIYIHNKAWDCDKTLDEVDDETFDVIFNYLKRYSGEYKVIYDLITGDDFWPATMDNERTGDDWDYAEIWIKDGKVIHLGCWTECLGITYWLEDYGVKWKQYEKTEEDYRREAEYEKEEAAHREERLNIFKESLESALADILPKMATEELDYNVDEDITKQGE